MSNWYTQYDATNITPEWRLFTTKPINRKPKVQICHVPCGRTIYENNDFISKIECRKCHQVLNKYWYPTVLKLILLHQLANLDIKI